MFKTIFSNALDNTRKEFQDFKSRYTLFMPHPISMIGGTRFLLLSKMNQKSQENFNMACVQIFTQLCKERNIFIDEPLVYQAGLDFVANINGVKTGFIVSGRQNFTPNLSDDVLNIIQKVNVIVLENPYEQEYTFYTPNNHTYKYKNIVDCILARDFFDLIDSDLYNIFLKNASEYTNAIEKELGLTISLLPTLNELEKHKDKTKQMLLRFVYLHDLNEIFNENELVKFQNRFSQHVDLLIGDYDFAKSFLSSEWNYNANRYLNSELDQTGIVAGYIKSIEQLFLAIFRSLCEEYTLEFLVNRRAITLQSATILRLQKYNNKYWNDKHLQTEFGNLIQYARKYSKDIMYYNPKYKAILDFIEEYKDDIRNEFFHKNNLYTRDEIVDIRQRTLCVLFLLLSTFKIDNEKFKQI